MKVRDDGGIGKGEINSVLVGLMADVHHGVQVDDCQE